MDTGSLLLAAVSTTSASNNTREHDISEMEARWLSLHSWQHNRVWEQWAASVDTPGFIDQICPGRGVYIIYIHIYMCTHYMCVWEKDRVIERRERESERECVICWNTSLHSHKSTLSMMKQQYLCRTKEVKENISVCTADTGKSVCVCVSHCTAKMKARHC